MSSLSLRPQLLTAVTRVTLQAACTCYKRGLGLECFVLHFAEIVCQTLYSIVALKSKGSNLPVQLPVLRVPNASQILSLIAVSFIATVANTVSSYRLLLAFQKSQQIN